MNTQSEMKPYVIGLDLGGTNSVFGIVDSRGEIKATTAIKTQGFDTVDDYVDASVNALQPGFNLCLQYFLPAFLFFASFADAVEYFQTAADGTADLVIQCFIDDSGCLFIGYTGIAQKLSFFIAFFSFFLIVMQSVHVKKNPFLLGYVGIQGKHLYLSDPGLLQQFKEFIDCFVRLLWVFEIRALVAKSKGNRFLCSRQRNKESTTVFLRLRSKTPEC